MGEDGHERIQAVAQRQRRRQRRPHALVAGAADGKQLGAPKDALPRIGPLAPHQLACRFQTYHPGHARVGGYCDDGLKEECRPRVAIRGHRREDKVAVAADHVTSIAQQWDGAIDRAGGQA